jgi:surfactin synthase thioesterase subunit
MILVSISQENKKLPLGSLRSDEAAAEEFAKKQTPGINLFLASLNADANSCQGLRIDHAHGHQCSRSDNEGDQDSIHSAISVRTWKVIVKDIRLRALKR